jgi:hypothetical protein
MLSNSLGGQIREIDEERVRRNLKFALSSPRGLLSLWPDDVIAVVNGVPFTRADKLAGKRDRQRRRLETIRRDDATRSVPCFVWVFDNGPIIPYGGVWMYVRTLRQDWRIERHADSLALRIMAAFGWLPCRELWPDFQRDFLRRYARPTTKRPRNNALCQAWAVVSPVGQLLEVTLAKPAGVTFGNKRSD